MAFPAGRNRFGRTAHHRNVTDRVAPRLARKPGHDRTPPRFRDAAAHSDAADALYPDRPAPAPRMAAVRAAGRPAASTAAAQRGAHRLSPRGGFSFLYL